MLHGKNKLCFVIKHNIKPGIREKLHLSVTLSSLHLSRSARVLSPQVQHHSLPLLLPQWGVLLRQPQRQILLAVHNRIYTHDACGWGADSTVHQQVWSKCFGTVKCQMQCSVKGYLLKLLSLQVFCVRGSIPGRGRSQSGLDHPQLSSRLEKSLDWIFLPHGKLMAVDNAIFIFFRTVLGFQLPTFIIHITYLPTVKDKLGITIFSHGERIRGTDGNRIKALYRCRIVRCILDTQGKMNSLLGFGPIQHSVSQTQWRPVKHYKQIQL